MTTLLPLALLLAAPPAYTPTADYAPRKSAASPSSSIPR